MKKKTLLALAASAMLFGVAGCANNTPYIGENGNWWVNSSDLGVPAQGPQGETGAPGSQGEKGDTGATGPQGSKGETGSQGVGVTVIKVEQSGSEGNVDTYTIYFSDGTTTTFTVTNGTNGDSITVTNVTLVSSVDGVDTYKITFSNGYTTTFTVKNGKDGKNLSVISIEIVGSSGLCDTYRINYSDGTYVEFVVTNGATPYIGDNGNWWINDVDTGVLADASRRNNSDISTIQKVFQDCFKYSIQTRYGVSGYVLESYDWPTDDKALFYNYKNELNMSYTEFQSYIDEIEGGTVPLSLVVPNYVGNIPVIGIGNNAFYSYHWFNEITLSNNTVFIGAGAFKSCNKLERVHANASKLRIVENNAFESCSSLESIDASTVEYVGTNAFSGCVLSDFDFEPLKFICSGAFSSYDQPVLLKNTVEMVESNAFNQTILYLEHETIPASWGENINGMSGCLFSDPFLNCKISGDYLYQAIDGKAKLLKYYGSDRIFRVPSSVDSFTVTSIASGFNCSIQPGDSMGREELERYEAQFDQIIVPSTCKTIDPYALANPCNLVYFEKGVEMVDACISKWGYFGAVVFEDASDVTFTEHESRNVYDANDKEELLQKFRTGYSYSDIVIGENDKVVLGKESDGYSLLKSIDFESNSITIPNSYNGKAIKTIMSYSYEVHFAKKISISDGIERIKSNAINYYFGGDKKTYVFVPSSVGRIVSSAIHATTIYTDAKTRPDDWDSNWTSSSVGYGKTRTWFDSFEIDGDYVYKVLSDDSVALMSYIGTSTTDLKLPRTLSGKTVTTILSDFIVFNRSSGTWIYIPKTITTIQSKAFVNQRWYCYFYFEASEKGEGISDDYYWHLNYSSTISYTEEYFNQNMGY